ncbi:MAG: Asparagine--tRNA ligase [Chloroflexi bacterium ADurb.Bin325]|nr:MAG: Asparagine--tRNA ligase [Chloroflexi bacterium ADurb.Bin325]
MQRIYTTEVAAHVGEHVRVAGWLHALRRLGGINFLVLRDARGIVQAVLDTPEALAALEGLLPETVLSVSGAAVAEPQAPGGVEIHGPTFEILSPVRDALPFPLNKPEVKATLPIFLDHAVIGHRHPARRSVMRLQAGAMAGFRATLAGLGFTEIQTPKLVGSATEGGANVFTVDYFGRPAYLAQSPQFYKQIMVGVFERVFEVGPVFRAEPHDTVRHINEYVSMDVEMGFIRDHRDVMAVLTQVVRGILGHLEAHYAPELAAVNAVLPAAPETFPAIYFPEAQELIHRLHGEDCRGEPDLAPQHERWLGEWARQEYGSDFLFVTGYPMAKRPFYTHPNPADPAYSNSFDLLFRGTELVTGGQRLHLYQAYLDSAAARGYTDLAPFETYFETFKYGMPPHGGFAIGLERFIMQLLGLDNVRLATLFPRDINRLAP